MKDYIEIFDSEGNPKKMEVVSIYKLKESKYNYMIYKELDDSKYYVAKYSGEGIVDLITELRESEIELANSLIEAMTNEKS